MNNAPYKSPYKSHANGITMESLDKKLHFLDKRITELEQLYCEAMEEQDSDDSDSIDLTVSQEPIAPPFKKRNAKTGYGLFE